MKHIVHNQTIVKTVTSGTTKDRYAVGQGATLTLVYAVHADKDVGLDAEVMLSGRGARAVVIGLVTGGKRGVVKLHTLQRHDAAETTSTLLIKSALYDDSACQYEGSIVVSKKAQKTDAYQRNENLLLGSGAQATSSPILEIQANDVRCTHGAVVKTLDPHEMWYLASRGISRARARQMIVSGFLDSSLALIDDARERENVRQQVSRMP